ncbi:hypothetical protein CFOL_v3_12838 [Cephalotus follicularis]|uniref:Uncharacterized protein n=1 Tax=Cephalotus follicularis TaxID=3775 RepID=A0A1Q3BMS9_CEPFO|nr:hypothetical protein CFOL_v3_12838 [Cephalotus follicularis]
MHVVFDESNPKLPKEVNVDDCVDFIENGVNKLNLDEAKREESTEGETPQDEYQEALHDRTLKVVRGHPHEAIIGNPRLGVSTRSSIKNNYIAFFYLKSSLKI